MQDIITFSFGKNWQDFISKADELAVQGALTDIDEWLGHDVINGKRVLDIGCGSGIHSLCFHRLGAKELVSFDFDRSSVAATTECYRRAGEPENWQVLHGSILDQAFLRSLGTYDVVYSWGVLHHTGSMWEAIENAATCVAPGGIFWIALYHKGPNYQRHLTLKRRYNRASLFRKNVMVWTRMFGKMCKSVMRGNTLFVWNKRKERGMDVYHNLIDWLGGLPYEVASVKEVEELLAKQGLTLQCAQETHERHNDVYLFRKSFEKSEAVG